MKSDQTQITQLELLTQIVSYMLEIIQESNLTIGIVIQDELFIYQNPVSFDHIISLLKHSVSSSIFVFILKQQHINKLDFQITWCAVHLKGPSDSSLSLLSTSRTDTVIGGCGSNRTWSRKRRDLVLFSIQASKYVVSYIYPSAHQKLPLLPA